MTAEGREACPGDRAIHQSEDRAGEAGRFQLPIHRALR
jgi:hypothetical protein